MTGKCDCIADYGGSSCGTYCPNACSGHGTCGQKECTTDIAQENIPAATKAELTAKYKIPGNQVSCSVAGSQGLCCEVLNGQLVKDLCCATCANDNCPSIEISTTKATGKCGYGMK